MISIIIPCYNRAHLIGDTLDSIIQQTYSNWECIVVDDGSIDNSLMVLEKYTNIDSRINFFKRPNSKPKGANACRNYGFEKSLGEYVIFFDSDDIMLPYKLELQLSLLKSGDYDFSVTQTELFNTKTNKSLGLRAPQLTSENLIEDFINFKAFWLFPSVLWKKEFLTLNNLFLDETIQQAQDYDFHLTVLKQKYNYISDETVTTHVLIHGENMSNSTLNSPQKIFSNAYVQNRILTEFKKKISETTYVNSLKILLGFYREAIRKRQVVNAIKIFQFLWNKPLLQFGISKRLIFLSLIYPLLGVGYKFTKIYVKC